LERTEINQKQLRAKYKQLHHTLYSEMSTARKIWTIVGAILTGGMTIALSLGETAARSPMN